MPYQIWIENENDINTWMCFVKDFEVDEMPQNAVMKVAADSKYRFWLNGSEVVFEGGLKRGESRNSTYYDEIDAAKYLKPGKNRAAFLVWFFGDDGFSHISSGKGGLYAESAFLNTDSTWKVKKHPAYFTPENDTPSNFRLAESNVWFDAGKDPGNWTAPEYDVSSWQSADEINPGSLGKLVPRIIPMFKDFGCKKYVNSAEYEGLEVTGDTVLAMKLPYNAQIMPRLKVDAPAGLTITVKADNYEDALYDTKSVMAGYVTRKGVQEYECFGWINGETMFYDVPSGVKILELGYRETGYDTEFKGGYAGNDDFLKKLWEKSARTLYITMRDSFMDCPDRERAQWWGDVNLEMQMIRHCLDDRAFLLYKKGVRMMAEYAGEAGHMITVVPSGKDQFELPMQNLAGIYGFFEYYRWTGDKETVGIAYPMAIQYLRLFDMENGLVKHRTGSWDWPDWGENADIPVMENAWYYMALRSAEKMIGVLTDGNVSGENGQDLLTDLNFIRKRMALIEENFDKTFLKGNRYYGFTSNGRPDDRANALAALSGLAGKERYEGIEHILETTENASPYMEYYVLEAMCEMGYTKEAVSRIKRRYKDMVNDPYSTLWEYWDTTGTKNHAWSGGPLIIMAKYL